MRTPKIWVSPSLWRPYTIMTGEYTLVDICGPLDGGTRMARTTAGALYRHQSGGWQCFDFNKEYAGYYPSCSFTALAYVKTAFYLAGVDDSGIPCVFCSILGGVWERVHLTAKHPLWGEVYASGHIVCILCEECQGQIFLICNSGQLVVLPDCPHCVRILDIKPGAVDGFLKNGEIVVSYVDKSIEKVSVEDALQYRASMRFMRQSVSQGGVLVDVRFDEAYAAAPTSGSIHIPLEDLDTWLQTHDKLQLIFFICQVGIQADYAAKYARSVGFLKSYSVGGINALAHTE